MTLAMSRSRSYTLRLASAAIFAAAFGYLEAAIVVYLRALYYPDGFSFPLASMPQRMLLIELGREGATLIMLAAAAALAGRWFWERFGYFLVMFGIWDILFYLGLKLTLDWPTTLLDWDILFLIPLPWIAPVIAPVLVAVLMIACGGAITARYARGGHLRVPLISWVLALTATALILYSFMRDTNATLRQEMPQPYLYGLWIAGCALYAVAFWLACLPRGAGGRGGT